jgi:hypothetical protein
LVFHLLTSRGRALDLLVMSEHLLGLHPSISFQRWLSPWRRANLY